MTVPWPPLSSHSLYRRAAALLQGGRATTRSAICQWSIQRNQMQSIILLLIEKSLKNAGDHRDVDVARL